MIPRPQPRGFWDYALFAFVMTGMLVLLFWLEAGDRIDWADVTVAVAAAVLLVFAIILARRGEKAKWIAQPTRSIYLLSALATLMLMFAAIYADAYLFHRKDIVFDRVRRDVIIFIVVTAGTLCSSWVRFSGKRQSLQTDGDRAH